MAGAGRRVEPPELTEAWQALARGAIDEAADRFDVIVSCGDSGGALEGVALVRYLRCDYRGSLAAHERAYGAYRREGNRLAAGRMARMVAWMSGNMFGEWAVRSGWLGRARTLLDEVDAESAERGWVLLLDAETEPDPAAREALYRDAHALGQRFGDSAIEFEALGWLGLHRAIQGSVDEGLRLLDQALAAVVAGEVTDLYVIEGTFCGLFWACERFHDVSRAEQWIGAAHELVRRRHLVAVGGYCRAHYGGILTAAGRWAEAESELTAAARLFDRGYTALRGEVELRLAELRVRQGRYEDAARLLAPLGDHPDAAHPLASLHLVHGRPAVARELLERRLSHEGLDHDVAAPLWSLLVEVQLADGDLAAAAESVDRLVSIAAQRPGMAYLVASAALAQGRLCAVRREAAAAACLRRALHAFGRAQTPLEAGRTRVELARLLADDNPEVAIAEARAALAAFHQLAAPALVDEASSLLRSLGVRFGPGPRQSADLTKREAEVLGLVGEGLSNAEIAERLFLSRKTVEHHVGRVLMKLGLRNRAEAAVHAARARSGSQ